MTAVDWKLSRRVAARFSGTAEFEDTYHFRHYARQAPDLVARAAGLAADETGLGWVGEPDVAVVTRREWTETNLDGFGRLLAPAERRLEGSGLGRRLASRLMGAEVGALVGILSRRVLGQYELVLPSADGDTGDTVMFVGSNVMEMERRHEFRPEEFRFWVALHECTHRLQFTGVPWLRDHFLGLVERLVEVSAPEPGRVQRIRDDMKVAAREGRPLIDERGLMGLLATPEQRALIDQVQALMSLLEGHGHVVMDRIGARVLVSQDRMARVLKMRRKDPRMAAFLRLTGLEMKMKQYEEGERFILGVERQAGFEALDHAWTAPETLPTLAEIRNPERWLARVG